MSTICGILRKDGSSVPPQELSRMLDALDHWGADARGSWSSDTVALGHHLLRSTPLLRMDSQPERDGDGTLAVTGDIRLDNREELAGELGISRRDLSNCTDARLVLAAYRRWDDETPRHLLGDFAFAVWDGRRRRLFCARDPLGVKPFYYHDGPRAFVFASEMKGVLALDGVPRDVDELWVADFLCRFRLDRTRSLWAGIRRLEPAHALVVDPGGTRCRRYWTLDTDRELDLEDSEAYVEGFRERLFRAVRRRLSAEGEVGAELSGGLDSSGIVVVARRLLESQGRALHTFSQVRPPATGDLPLPEDARGAVESVCAAAGIDNPCFLTGEGQGILSAVEWGAARYDEPPRLIVSLFNDRLYAAARARGVGILLSGFGGNQAVTSGGSGVLEELLDRRAWGDLWDELVAAGGRRTALRLLVRLLLRESPLSAPLNRWLDRRDAFWQKLPYRAVRDSLAERVDMEERARAFLDAQSRAGSTSERLRRKLDAPAVSLRMEYADLSTKGRRMEYRYPLLDLELIRFYLATPPRMRRWRGTGRYLFRRSMEGLLPDEVRLASGRRASANPGSVPRKRADREAVWDAVRAIPAESKVFDYVDLEKLSARPQIERGGEDRPWERDTHLIQILLLHRILARLGGG